MACHVVLFALQVIVVDEIGGTKEVNAVKTIAQRGVVMVATAHGVSLANLIKNPDLNSLVGGVCQVTIGDAAARGYAQKPMWVLKFCSALKFCSSLRVWHSFANCKEHSMYHAILD